MGPCPNLHSSTLKAEYEEEKKEKQRKESNSSSSSTASTGNNYYGIYEGELERHLASLVGECDRKIVKASKRLEENRQSAKV